VIEFEKFLAPWEVDADGKKLDEPAEVDAGKLKKYLYNLLTDKEKLQETVADKDSEIANTKETLATVQREHETKDQAAAREQKERDAEFEKLRKEGEQRRKIEAIEDAFAKEGITPAQAKKLAKRVQGDEKDWVADAKELVEDGFKVGTTTVVKTDDGDDGDDLRTRPHQVRRADGEPVVEVSSNKKKSVADEVNAAIPFSGW